MSEYTVIDVSSYQGTIDWNKVKPQIKAAIIKIGHGSDIKSQDDSQAIRNITECERLGIPWGVYVYSYASNVSMVQSEYAHMNRVLGSHKPIMPWYIDLEENSLASFARKAAEEWTRLCKADGKLPGVYTGYYYFNTHIRGIDTSQASWWIASYGTNSGKPEAQAKPNVGFNYDGWQYTSKKRYDGISTGGVDTSLFYKEFGQTGKWIQSWMYRNADGTYKKNGWWYDGKDWYYFDKDGRALQNEWIKYKNEWYYLKKDCRMAHDEWVNDGKGWAYLDKDGKALHDQWLKYKNDWYYLKSNCYMAANECIPYKDKGKCCVDKNGKWDGKYV